MHTPPTRLLLMLLLASALSACTAVNYSSSACASSAFQINASFPGGAMGECVTVSTTEFRLRLQPENKPINPSPWYSFHVVGTGSLSLTLDYGEFNHRYTPKWSTDGVSWTTLADDQFQVASDRKSLNLQLELVDELYISAQENLDSKFYDRWLTALTETYPDLIRSEIGSSVGGRPIWAVETNPAASNVMLFVGRQHPPEVTGALAMIAFIERLLSYHPSVCTDANVCKFYQDTNIIFVPLLNPDGVDLGHWRHNLQGIDINRDWRDFASPEIRSVRDLIDRLATTSTFRLFLDFHSTYREVFYTQGRGYKTSPENFAENWLRRAGESKTYELENAQRRTTQLGTSKNYIHSRFGIPAITFELGDETSRQDIHTTAQVLADAAIAEIYPYQVGADTLIKGGTIVDGSGRKGFVGNIALHGDRIIYVGPKDIPANQVIDATGLIVSPGFIDPHTHTSSTLQSKAEAANLPYLHQGVTTVFFGNDGDGMDFSSQADQVRSANPGTNVGLWRGHGALRAEVVGQENRVASELEMEKMEEIVGEDVLAGALGLSTGLFYAPGSYAPTEEVIRLAKAAARHGGIYDTHIRDESTYSIGLLAAIDEAIEISAAADIPTHIAHIKALGPDVTGQSKQIVQRIRTAREDGLDVTADQYPWLASGTRFSSALVPRWAQIGGRSGMLEALQNPPDQQKLFDEMSDNLVRRGGATKLLVTGDSQFKGKTLAEVAEVKGVSPVVAAISEIVDGDPAVASFMMDEDDVMHLMSQPWVVTGSDGTQGHPRKFATFPEKFQRYSKQLALFDIETFVHRSSGKTAEIFRLCDRGTLTVGKKADVAVWHPEKYQPRATYKTPNKLSEGVEHLWVNGHAAIRDGLATTKRGGQIVSSQDCRSN